MLGNSRRRSLKLGLVSMPDRREADALSASQPGSPRLLVEHTVTRVFGIDLVDLHQPNRGRANIALARQAAMYHAHTGLGLSMAEAGLLFDRDRTTVSHACALIEDRRDDANFDLALELLERAVNAMGTPGFGMMPAYSRR